jgi:anti-anti-sigma factor
MEITETEQGGARIASLSGRLDTASAPAAEEKLLGMLRGGGALVVDLGAVHYVSSAGLRALLKAAKQAKAAGAAFALAAPQPPVREVLEISGFDKILGVFATREEAVAGAK